jgi:hypothetical protein
MDSRDKSYHHYGRRGIKVCTEWTYDPGSFIAWAETHGWYDGSNLEIDRIDNNGDYCPENCRFVTTSENQNNRRSNHLITVGDETLTITQWSKQTGINKSTILCRLKLGWTVEDAVTIQDGKSRMITCNDEIRSIASWSRKTGISHTVIQSRLGLGWSEEDAVTTPAMQKTHRYITINNVTLTATQWAKKMGLGKGTISHRLTLGWSERDAVLTPPQTTNGRRSKHG